MESTWCLVLATFLLFGKWSTGNLQRCLNCMRRTWRKLAGLLCTPHTLWSYWCNWNLAWLKQGFAGPSGILRLLLLHFLWNWQLRRNKAPNAMVPHRIVLALASWHPYLGRGIQRILDRSIAGLPSSQLWLGLWWHFAPQIRCWTRKAKSANGRSSL